MRASSNRIDVRQTDQVRWCKYIETAEDRLEMMNTDVYKQPKRSRFH